MDGNDSESINFNGVWSNEDEMLLTAMRFIGNLFMLQLPIYRLSGARLVGQCLYIHIDYISWYSYESVYFAIDIQKLFYERNIPDYALLYTKLITSNIIDRIIDDEVRAWKKTTWIVNQ